MSTEKKILAFNQEELVMLKQALDGIHFTDGRLHEMSTKLQGRLETAARALDWSNG